MFYVTGTLGGNIVYLFLSDTSTNADQPGSYSLALSQTVSSAPESGSIYAIDAFTPGKAILEYNCYLTQLLTDWVVQAGTLEIESIVGNRATYKLFADMVPGTLNKTNTATFTIKFYGTTLFMSSPAGQE